MSEWQPIETAPNWNHVLLWLPKGEHVIGFKGSNGVWQLVGYAADWREEPTHWQELPPEPAEQAIQKAAGHG